MTQAGKPVYLVANWKSHKTLGDALEFMDTISVPSPRPDTHIVVCPPFPFVNPLSEKMVAVASPMELGVQDISPFPFGAYTGAVTGKMVNPPARYAIVGHSERRKYFKETNADVGNKVRAALDSSLTPILCLDEPYLETQLAMFTGEELTKVVVAYEPLAAIGSGVPDTPEHADEVAQKIISITEVEVPVLYGGSVTADTVKKFMDMPHISGVLVGAASLEPESWSAIVAAVSE